MVQPRGSRQPGVEATMPKSKKRKQRGVAARPAGTRSLAQSAANWPLYECLISGDWQNTEELTQIVVARRNPSNGAVIGAMFLVDLGCLGVKDASVLHFFSAAEYKNALEGSVMLLQLFKPASLDLTAKILHEAVAYARSLGFLPHGDYLDAQPLLQGAHPENVADVVPLGRAGKPFYLSGPDDHPGKILRQLERAVGAGNFDYMIMLPPGAEPPAGVDPAKINHISLDENYENERLGWLPLELIEALGDATPEQALELFRPVWPIAVAREFLAQAPPSVAAALADVAPEQLPEQVRPLLPMLLQTYFDSLVAAVPDSLDEYLDLLDTLDASEPDEAELAPEILAKLHSTDPREAAEADAFMLNQVLDDLMDVVPERKLNAMRSQPLEEAIPALLEALPADLRGILGPQLNMILELRGQKRDED
jgi:hypothetical protein